MDHLSHISVDAIDNRFLYVLLAAKRALQLQRGARPRLELGTKKPTVLAMSEVLQDKVQFELPERPDQKALASE